MNIQEEYNEGRRDFSYMRLEGVNLKGANLLGADFTNADFTNADFTNADFTGAYFNGAYLKDAIFTRAILDDADFTAAYLHGAVLTKTNSKSANFNSANLENSTINEAKFRHSELVGTDLENANLEGTDFTGADLTWANLIKANFTGAILDGTCIDPAAPLPPLTDEEILVAGLYPEGEWVYGWRTEMSAMKCEKYVPREEPYVAPVFSVDQRTPCHPGIYLASRKWLIEARWDLVVRCRCRRDELVHAGDKWRAKRLWIEEGRNEYSR
jgi:hypothetical protein